MLAKAVAIGGGAIAVVQNYPVVSDSLVRVVVELTTRLGLHIHGDALVAIVIVMAVVLGTAVQASVTPKAKLNKSAGKDVPSGQASGSAA